MMLRLDARAPLGLIDLPAIDRGIIGLAAAYRAITTATATTTPVD